MKQLIQENNFDELKEALRNSGSGLKIHSILLQILNDQTVNENDYGFEANMYQEEFLEGFDLYKALNESTVSKSHLRQYMSALIFLIFKMGGFIKLLADKAMQKGAYLSQIGDVYKVNPVLRSELQSFIDLLEEANDIKAIANVAAAKAQITLAIGNLLSKPEIGQDMLQFAISYENAGLKDQAIQIYQNILKDFECESVKLSSGLFPEITQVDTRTNEEIEIFENAKKRLDAITGQSLPEIKKVHVDTDLSAKKLVEEVNNQGKKMTENNNEKDNVGLRERLRRFFG